MDIFQPPKKKKVLRFCLFVRKLEKEYPFLLFVDMGKRKVGAMYFPQPTKNLSPRWEEK